MCALRSSHATTEWVSRRFRGLDSGAVRAMLREACPRHAAWIGFAQTLHKPGSGGAWVAESNREVVGFCARRPWDSDAEPGTCALEIVVAPVWRNRGVGTDLYQRALRSLRRSGASAVTCITSLDDLDSVVFFQRRGFEECARYVEARLSTDCDIPHVVSPKSTAVRICSLAELVRRRGFLHQLYELYVEVRSDAPSVGSGTSISFDRFLNTIVGGPAVLPEAFHVALENEEPIALSYLLAAPDGAELMTGFTGVGRRARGRGLAAALKVRGIQWAHENGFRSIATFCDQRNTAMLHINDTLGFRRGTSWLHMIRRMKLAGA